MQTVSVAETVTLPNRAFTIDQAMYEYLERKEENW